MRTFLLVAAVCFALLAVAHGLRLVLEGTGLLQSPVFVINFAPRKRWIRQ